MAHNLEIRNGKASMMYVGGEPWHGLGTALKKPATAIEAIQAASLNWRVKKVPLYASDDQVTHLVQGKYAMVREDLWENSDCCPVFGVVSQDYTPLQNSEAFAFFDPIVGKEAAIYHTAGALGDGERIWILAKLPSRIRVVGDDFADKFLLLSNSHDGNSSVQIKFTPVRVVCQNTLTLALSQGPSLNVSHTRNLQKRLREAERMLGLIHKRYGEIEDSFKKMVCVSMNSERVDVYLNSVFPDPRDPENEKALERARKNREWARYFFEQGDGNRMKEVKGTLWAAFNGVTEFIDHRQVYGERRLNSVWFGDGYLIKARAFQIAEQKMSAWN